MATSYIAENKGGQSFGERQEFLVLNHKERAISWAVPPPPLVFD
jgi:hypothetical protein